MAEVILRIAGEAVIVGGVVLEEVLLAEVTCRALQDEHVGDQAIEAGVDHGLEVLHGVSQDVLVVEFLAVPETHLAAVSERRMFGDTGAEGFLLTLSGDGRQLVCGILHLREDPLDGVLGRVVGLVVFILREQMVRKGRGAPPAHGVEHRQGAQEVGLGLDTVDPGVGGLGDLLQDQVAVIDYAIDALVHNPRSGVGRGDVVTARLLELVRGIRKGAASREVVVVEAVQEHDLLDAVDAGHVAAAPVQFIDTGDQGFRLVTGCIRVVILGREDALLSDIEILLAGAAHDQERCERQCGIYSFHTVCSFRKIHSHQRPVSWRSGRNRSRYPDRWRRSRRGSSPDRGRDIS